MPGPMSALSDRLTAMWILDGLYRYSVTGIRDVKVLQGIHKGKLRLRLGDYRLFFNADGEILRILRVRHRSRSLSLNYITILRGVGLDHLCFACSFRASVFDPAPLLSGLAIPQFQNLPEYFTLIL